MKQKICMALVAAVVVTLSGYNVYQSQKAKAEMSDTMLENVEALASGEGSGALCPKGCSDIGWGIDKILECDCNYDHFSCCNRWGC